MENNLICKEHSGLLARVKNMESNVTQLWSKWNGMQKVLIATLVGVIANLAILIFR